MNTTSFLSRFLVRAKSTEKSYGRQESTQQAKTCDDTCHRKVLIVEDDPPLQSILSSVLRKHDFEVRSASDGDEGLQLYNTWHPDLIITDVNMPKRNGLDLAAAIMKKDEKSKLLFMTACFTDPELETRYRNEFANVPNCKLLLKPFGYDILLQLIRFMLEEQV